MAQLGKIYESGKNCYVVFIIVQGREDEAELNILSVDMKNVGRIR